jgi:hypothetical protein
MHKVIRKEQPQKQRKLRNSEEKHPTLNRSNQEILNSNLSSKIPRDLPVQSVIPVFRVSVGILQILRFAHSIQSGEQVNFVRNVAPSKLLRQLDSIGRYPDHQFFDFWVEGHNADIASFPEIALFVDELDFVDEENIG